VSTRAIGSALGIADATVVVILQLRRMTQSISLRS
jgi:hypothetical protein